MNKKLIEFIKNEVPTANVVNALKSKKDEILKLHFSGYARHQIVKYLRFTYKLVTSRQTLSKFIKEELER
jgi:hypothetical protein